MADEARALVRTSDDGSALYHLLGSIAEASRSSRAMRDALGEAPEPGSLADTKLSPPHLAGGELELVQDALESHSQPRCARQVRSECASASVGFIDPCRSNAAWIHRRDELWEGPLDLLINNAGIQAPARGA